MSSNSGGKRVRRVSASGRHGLNFVQFKDLGENGRERFRYELKVVPAPDVLKRQRGRRHMGSHNGDPYHSEVAENRRPRLDKAFEAAEQLADYEAGILDQSLVVSAPGQLRRAHVTHHGDVVVETTEGEVERYKKAA